MIICGLILLCVLAGPLMTDSAWAETKRIVVMGHGTYNEAQLKDIKKGILKATNEERKQKGLKPLEAADALDKGALLHTNAMCEIELLRHESDKFPKGRQTFEERMKALNVSAAAENIALRTTEKTTDAWTEKVMSGWMHSPGHRKNILTPKFRYLGVGVKQCKNNVVYATQIFAVTPGNNP